MYINYKASIFCQQLHSSSYLQWLIKSPYLIPRDLAGLRRYLISISFACSCARFFTSHWKTHLAYRSSLDPLLSPKKYERKHHRLIRSFWVLNFLYLSLPDAMQTFIYIYKWIAEMYVRAQFLNDCTKSDFLFCVCYCQDMFCIKGNWEISSVYWQD